MTYELWSKVSRSAVGGFDTETAALAAVCEAIDTHGRAYAEELVMIREDGRGRSRLVAEGAELMERALKGAPRAGRKSA